MLKKRLVVLLLMVMAVGVYAQSIPSGTGRFEALGNSPYILDAATDINNNKEIIFEKGKIFPGLIGSISIPGFFSPIKFDNKYLVDGGVMDNIPASLIKDSNKILISDITGPIKKIDEKSLATDVLYSSIAMMQRNISLQKIEKLDKKIIYLNLEDDKTFILDFRKKNYQTLIELGYKAVMERRKDLWLIKIGI